MKKISISFAMARFIFVSYLALALLTSFIVVSQAVKSVDQQQQTFVKLETDTISKSYRQFLTNHQMILREQSEHPLIIQSMMQSDVNRLKIAEYFSHLKFLGRQHQLSLLDFQGQFIYATHGNAAFYHDDASWVQSLLNGSQTQHIAIKKVENNYYWVLAQTVRYHGEVEGILTVSIAVDALIKTIGAPQGLAIKLLYNNELIASFGTVDNGITRHIDWAIDGLSLIFVYDDTSINQAIDQLIIQLTVLIVIAILIISGLAFYYGRRYIVSPVLGLAKATNSLEYGDVYEPLKTEIKIKELATLTKNFNQMSQTIRHREQALLTSKQELEQSHKDLQESEAQRIQNEKMASLGVLVAGVAHEINNPIGFVKSNIDTLQHYWSDIRQLLDELNSLPGAPELSQKIAEIYAKYDAAFIIDDINPLIDSTNNGIFRVTEIIKSLKTFARNDSPDKVLSDINEGVSATLVMAQNELKYHCDIDVDLCTVPATLMFPSKINQVLMNLLLNAGQAIEGKGKISVSTGVSGNNIFVKITDDGMGIEKEKLAQIFMPFYTSNPVGQGTGLGLSISHRIIEQHDGKIEVESTVGQGSCFTVYLPILSPN